jgi:hypothetical protein
MSSPRTRKDRKWLIQGVGQGGAVFVMASWSRKEVLIASFVHFFNGFRLLTLFIRLFIADVDVTFSRFQKVARICGYIPRPFFFSAVSPENLSETTLDVRHAISTCKDLPDAISRVHGDHIVRSYYAPVP